MTSPLRTVVIVPTYEEADNIAEMLTSVRTSAPTAHVLVVDDNSPDGTASIAEALGFKLGQIDVLRRPGKAGLGAAYRAGFDWALARGYEVCVEMDADLSHDPRQLPALLAAVDDGADLAIGSRYVPGASIPDWPRRRRLLSSGGNRYAAAMLRLGIRDMTSGFRAYRASVLRRALVDQSQADGYGFQIEMAWRVTQVGGDVREVPITFIDRTKGASKISRSVVLEALRLVSVSGVELRLRRFSPVRGGLGAGLGSPVSARS